MKKVYKLFLVTVLATGTLFQSCETTELELIDNPNALTEGDPQFLLNSIQSAYRAAQVTFNDRSSELTRIDYMFGRNYFNNYGAGTMNGPWGNLYSSILPDLKAIEAAQNDNNDLRFHIAMGKIMQAHIMMQLVDFIGNIVPMDQAGDPIGIPTPEPYTDGGTAAYADAIAILDEAIALLNQNPSNLNLQDLFYGDNTGANSTPGAWIKVANTLKMRAALTTGDMATFNNIVAGDNFISDPADDLEFKFGTLLAPANTQHQDYQNDYTSSGANIYQSNWLMQTMLDNNDPRMRYYFYRQNGCTPGASCDPDGDGETLSCSLESTPTHLQGTPCGAIWCSMENGYWGRIHGDDDGTPPDNFTRTAVGVYPAGGNTDADRFRTGTIQFNEDDGVYEFVLNGSGVNLGQGANGAGIEPIILSSYVDFWRAEAALASGGNASMHFRNGLEASMTKTTTAVVDTGFDGGALLDDTTFNAATGDVINPVLASSLLPSAQDFDDYVDDMVAQFDAAVGDAKWEILAEQYFVTMFGGGADAHNFYRRTGFPTSVCPNIEADPGNYPRTFLYPSNEVIANPNFSQRTTNDEPVFWNTQPLPPSN